ncbi:hypothetical protein [Enterocloster bolteae]|uniref:hypothetical protein n=1 Tax=Enterocloster bolteae TaxID=208479 RepID=UPI0018A09386|nr:hypothetical protein [Enterocloster bolteae]
MKIYAGLWGNACKTGNRRYGNGETAACNAAAIVRKAGLAGWGSEWYNPKFDSLEC